MTESTLPISKDAAERVADQLSWPENGLLPAITMEAGTNQLLMQAWMNREAFIQTLTTGTVCYYSRSRKGLWIKGETSGHTQELIDLRIDCDYDSIQLLIHQTGPACHTNRKHCFFFAVDGEGELHTVCDPMI